MTQNARGDEVTTKINNEEMMTSQYDEEAVCQEIQDELGVLPIQFKYRPNGMELTWYQIDLVTGEAILEYSVNENFIHIYIFEKNDNSTISAQYDGVVLGTETIESVGEDVPLYEIEGSSEGTYYEITFDYLNTSYSISSAMEKEEFQKIIENILIKSE